MKENGIHTKNDGNVHGRAVLVLRTGAASFTSESGTCHDNLFDMVGLEDVLDENGEPKIAVRVRVFDGDVLAAGGVLPSWFSVAHRESALKAARLLG